MGSTRSLGLCLAAQLLGPSAPSVRRVTALLAAGPARCPQPMLPAVDSGSCGSAWPGPIGVEMFPSLRPVLRRITLLGRELPLPSSLKLPRCHPWALPLTISVGCSQEELGSLTFTGSCRLLPAHTAPAQLPLALAIPVLVGRSCSLCAAHPLGTLILHGESTSSRLTLQPGSSVTSRPTITRCVPVCMTLFSPRCHTLHFSLPSREIP